MSAHPPGISSDILSRALEAAARRGASAAEAGVAQGSGLSVTVRMGEIETIEHQRDKALSVTVYFDGRTGSARTSDLGPAAVADTVAAACSIAAFGGEDDCAGLAAAGQMARDVPDLALEHPWRIDAAQAARIALRAEQAARGFDPRISSSDGATVSTGGARRIYANSHGFLGAYTSTRHSVRSAVIATAGGQMQRDYWYSAARDPTALEDPESVGARSAERAVRRLGARPIETCRVPVIYAADVARSLFGHFIAAVSGGALYRKASFLLDRLGEQIFPPGFHLAERPRLPRAMGSAPFDADGVATRDRDIVSDGVLASYVLSAYSARKLGLETTGNAGGARNVVVAPGRFTGPRRADAPSLNDLFAEMGCGLYVTELIGMGANTVTGDYSRGASGFWVENGTLCHPVEEITVAGHLTDMFSHLLAVAGDVDTRANIRTGSVLIEAMTVGGVGPA